MNNTRIKAFCQLFIFNLKIIIDIGFSVGIMETTKEADMKNKHWNFFKDICALVVIGAIFAAIIVFAVEQM